MPSRQNINPHPHTFSIARRIRRKPAAASFKGIALSEIRGDSTCTFYFDRAPPRTSD
jgi:hypothetical protein